ncbi:hypothetical protein FRC10_012129, partial [Ceratobasidium sp. 414]
MSKALDQGMVLMMSVWDDHAVNMLWLDSDYPMAASGSSPGVHHGSRAMTSGVPADVEVSVVDLYRYDNWHNDQQPCYFDNQETSLSLA